MAGKALYLIAATDRKQGIGFKNDLPWHLEREYAYFERMSTVTQQPNKMVIMSAYLRYTVYKLDPHLYVLSGVYRRFNSLYGIYCSLGKLRRYAEATIQTNFTSAVHRCSS
jgi:hypothetical protein